MLGAQVLVRADSVPLEKLVQSTWQVNLSGGKFGSAFLISNEGYFVTAAHVVARSNGPKGPVFYESIKLGPGADPAAKTVDAVLVKSWCKEFDAIRQICRQGSDAVLLKTSAIDSKYRPFDIGFAASTPGAFRAVFTGYSSRVVGAAPSAEVIFNIVNVASHDEYKEYFTTGSTIFYQTVGESFPGNSGGPIAVDTTRGFEVVGIMTWRKPGFADTDSAGPSYGATIDVMRNIWSAVPRSPATQSLMAAVEAGSIAVPTFVDRLARGSNTEVVSLIAQMRAREQQPGFQTPVAPAYWSALYDAATVRELDWDKDFLEEHVNVSRNVSWLRDAAKSKRRIGDYYYRSNDRERASTSYKEAIERNKLFLKTAREKPAAWYGPMVFGDAVGEISALHFRLGQPQAAIEWATLGAQSGAVNLTGQLANRAYSFRDFRASANLFALAYQQAEITGRDAPKYVVEGYEQSIGALPPLVQFPKSIDQVAPRDASKQVAELKWIGSNWKNLAEEYAPDFVEY